MEIKHIKDCWTLIKAAKTIEEVKKIFEELPRWSGEWEVEVEDDQYLVTNTYYDRQYCEWNSDSDYLDIEVEEDEDE